MTSPGPEVQGLLREMDGSLTTLEHILLSIDNFNTEERERKLNKCEMYIKSVRTSKEAIQLEARLLAPVELASLQDMMRSRLSAYKKLLDQYEYKKAEIDRRLLQSDTGAEEFGTGGAEGNDVERIAAQGDALQDKTDAAISNMAGLVVDAQDIGLGTAARVDRQILQMEKIGEQLGTVQGNTARVDLTVGSMARGAASDLCIQILCGSIIVCVITIIVLISI